MRRSTGRRARIERLLGQPSRYVVAADPARPDFLYRSTERGLPLLYRWDAVRAAGALVSPADAPVTSVAALHPRRPLAAYARDDAGDENCHVLVADLETGDVRPVTDTPLGKVHRLFWDGRDLLVIGHDADSVYVCRLTLDGQRRDLLTTDEHVITADYDPARARMVLSVGRGPGTRLAVVDTRGGEVHRWISEGEASEDVHPALESTTGRLAYATDMGGDVQQVVVRDDPLAGEPVLRTQVPGTIGLLGGALAWHGADRLVAITDRHAEPVVRRLDVRRGRWSAPLGTVAPSALGVTSAGPVWSGSTFARPPQIERWRGDGDGGAVETLLAPSTAAGAGVSGEAHWFRSFDGRRVQGWLLRSAAPDAALAVYAHGGPTWSVKRGWDVILQAVAQGGYHVFAPNYRGSPGFGSAFQNLLPGDMGGDELRDVRAAGQFARALLGLEGRPAIFGDSYGGYLTLMALTTQPDDWAGGVAYVPSVDHAYSYANTDAHYRRYIAHFMGGTPDEIPQRYRERSPLTHVARLRAPLRVLHGEHDARCPVEPVRRFAALAAELGLPVELIVSSDEGHGAARRDELARWLLLTLEHLDRVFGRRPPADGKAAL